MFLFVPVFQIIQKRCHVLSLDIEDDQHNDGQNCQHCDREVILPVEKVSHQDAPEHARRAACRRYQQKRSESDLG